MNEPTLSVSREFVFQRLNEPFPFSAPETPAWVAMMVGGALLLFALLSFVIPLLRVMKSVVAGVAVRLLAWVAFAYLGATVWVGLNAVADDATRPGLFNALIVGQVALALVAIVSILLTILNGAAARERGGSTEGLAFGTALTVFFGRADTGPRGWWHVFAALLRALLYLVPLGCLVVARQFDQIDTEPIWWAFTGGMLAVASALTFHMYLRDSGATPWWGLFLVLAATAAAVCVNAAVVNLVSRKPDQAVPPYWEPLMYSLLIGGPLLALLPSALLALLPRSRHAGGGGWLKVSPLAVLRVAALSALAFCFLLPAIQPWEVTTKTSQVVILLDISPSVAEVSDDISRDPNAILKTRMDRVIDFLVAADEKGTFVGKLLAKNPVKVYRFGSQLDSEPDTIPGGPEKDAASNLWTKEQWKAFVKYDFKDYVLKYKGADGAGFSDAGQEALKLAQVWGGDNEPGTHEWAARWAAAKEDEVGLTTLTEADRKLADALRAKVAKRADVARVITSGTALPEAATGVINREQPNLTQAVIVFSDGKSNLSADGAVSDLNRRAREANIPVFTIGVGAAREVVSLLVSDLQVPDRTIPDEPTQITVGVDGVGFKEGEGTRVRGATNEGVPTILELFLPGKDPKTDKADHEVTLPAKLGPGETPHGEVTFKLDPEELAKQGKMTLVEEISPPKPGRKWQLKKGTWKVRAKVERDDRETFRDDFHLSPVRTMEVSDTKLRVLLVASAANREYQTLRTLLVREMDQKRCELTIYMQNEGGVKGLIVQDVPPGRLLLKFPDELDVSRKTTALPPGETPGDPNSEAEITKSRARLNNLDEYDLIIAFDPDWNQKDDGGGYRIPSEAFNKVKTWVQTLGGGFVYVAGPFFTNQLARGEGEGERLKPLLDILPVEPDDNVASDDVLIKINGRKTPRRLKLTPPADSDLLRLDDVAVAVGEKDKAVAGWEKFFTDQDATPKKTAAGGSTDPYLFPTRGFFSYYPVKSVKPGVKPLAEFVNIDEKGEEALRPFYAVSQSGAGRGAWLGSAEIFRLRATPEQGVNYYDKFWLQLARYAVAKRNSGAKARGQLFIGKEFPAGAPIRIQAKVLTASGDPYPENDPDPPKLTIDQLDQNGNVVARFGPFKDGLNPTKLTQKFEGYYKGVVPADSKMKPGEFRYRVNVSKGDLPEPLTSDFILRAANPELDNTKPDFAALAAAATPAKDALDREPDLGKRSELARQLGASADDIRTLKAKLAFKLDEPLRAQMIPDLIRSDRRSPQSRGKVDPLWDDVYNPAADRLTDWARDTSWFSSIGLNDDDRRFAASDNFFLRTPVASWPSGGVTVTLRWWVPVFAGVLLLLIGSWVVTSFVNNSWLKLLLAVGSFVLLLVAQLTLFLGMAFPLGAWLPTLFALQLALAVTWALRSRADLPPGGSLEDTVPVAFGGFVIVSAALALLTFIGTGVMVQNGVSSDVAGPLATAGYGLSVIVGLGLAVGCIFGGPLRPALAKLTVTLTVVFAALLFIPAGLAAALPPALALRGAMFGPNGADVTTLVGYALCLIPGLGLAVAYLFAGKHRPAVAGVTLTLAMLSQVLWMALGMWYGNAVPQWGEPWFIEQRWSGDPLSVGYIVLAVAAFLCAEWTLRKLYRLA